MTARKNICIIAFLFFLPTAASAATVSLQATPARIGAGDTVRVDILLTSAVPANAFSGELAYSKTLEPVAISDGNSIINLWITHPAVSSTGAPISFAGVTPGGFSGDSGTLFSVMFRATAAGTASITLGSIQILRNDGKGSPEPTTMKPLTLSVGLSPSGGYAEPPDAIPPGVFTVHLGSDSQIFNGRNYLIFMASDKGSGIDHYEVAESRFPPFLSALAPLAWKTASSPYLIADQTLVSTVYIKAVDRAGNERLSIYPPQHLFTTYEKSVILVILSIVVLLFMFRRRWGRRFRKNP